MTHCEICGAEEHLVSAIIEGTVMEVCSKCSGFGDIIKVDTPAITVSHQPRKIQVEEVNEYINDNYPALIKEAREKHSLKQSELAEKIGEKESVIHKLESGHMRPPITMAVKLQKLLSIHLIEHYEEPETKSLNINDPELTIGDLVKLRKRK
mgnify:CR=1